MAVLRRVEQVHDTRVATSTVVGMVLGVLGLFVLVITYQFVPRRGRSRSTAVSSLAPPTPKPRPLLTRIRARCITFVTPLFHKRQPTTTEPAEAGHRTLRSFHLTPERRREREHNKRKFATSLRLKIDIPAFPHISSRNTPSSSPRPPKRCYTRMKDGDEMYERLTKPDSVVISPWSPFGEGSPTTPPPRFKPFASPVTSPCTPPPLYPPPPAYVPGTPLRYSAIPADGDEKYKKRHALADPFADPFDEPGREETEEDPDTLMAEIQQIIEYSMHHEEPQAGEGAFVIGDGDEEDIGSLSECSV